PSPMYFLSSLASISYDPSRLIREYLDRSVGGPIASLGVLFPSYFDYSSKMSSIIEQPYAELYNLMLEVSLPSYKRTFPPSTNVLGLDEGNSIELRNKEEVRYTGSIEASRCFDVIQGRVQVEVSSIDQFWNRFFKQGDQTLHLDSVVRIRNSQGSSLVVPPYGTPAPLQITGGGLIILDQGDVIIRGVRVPYSYEALSIVAPRAALVKFEETDVHHINIVAPMARFLSEANLQIYGSIDVGDVPGDSRNQGGVIRYREIQDPTQDGYGKFYKACVGEKDSTWYE
ncbi:hypothetical protein HYY75_05225, partial [bacterium]|nr:hypothetical protein [bacterium]